MALSKQPYKGARDFYPEDKRLQKYIFSKWRVVAERYGYEEYDAPILESLEIYQAKTGDEIVNEQTYQFKDRGGREVVIRPEMTPTVSRMVAARRQELGYPLRWYSIPNLWRYERPQRGRLREHWQLNVDIFGVESTAAEFEMISLINDIFKAFGASPKMYEIRLNHRGLVNYLLDEYLSLSGKSRKSVGKLIDRLEKMPRTTFISKLDEILTAKEKESGITEKILNILESKKLTDLPTKVTKLPAFNELKNLLQQLKSAGITNTNYDASLMRGFDYYTGIVFEVYDLDPDNNRSMLGGGRYDGLVGLFGVAAVPTVGFGWGDVTLVNFLQNHSLLPEIKPESDAYVALIGDIDASSVISNLRKQGLNLAVDLSGKKLGDQLKTAGKKGLRYVIIIGENELKTGKLNLKDLEMGKEIVADIKTIIKTVKTK